MGGLSLKPMWELSNFPLGGGARRALSSTATISLCVHPQHLCDRSIPGAGRHPALCTCQSPASNTLPGNADSLLKAKLNGTTPGKLPCNPLPRAAFLWAPRFLSIPWCPSGVSSVSSPVVPPD